MKEIIKKSPQDIFLAIQEQANGLADICNQIEITDCESFKNATQSYETLNKVINKIEYIRKKESGKFFKEFKSINAFAKSLSEPLSDALEAGKKKLLDSGMHEKISYKLKWEISDESEIPREWLMLDEKKLKEYIKDKDFIEDGEVINGIVFYREAEVKI